MLRVSGTRSTIHHSSDLTKIHVAHVRPMARPVALKALCNWQPVQRISRLIAFAPVVMNLPSLALLTCTWSHAGWKAVRESEQREDITSPSVPRHAPTRASGVSVGPRPTDARSVNHLGPEQGHADRDHVHVLCQACTSSSWSSACHWSVVRDATRNLEANVSASPFSRIAASACVPSP